MPPAESKTPKEWIAYLRSIQSFSDEEMKVLLNLCSVERIRKGNRLQDIGKTCNTIYFVRNGIARIFYYKDGVDITEYFAFQNDLIIRAESLFSNSPSHKGIEALEDTTFLSIPAKPLFSCFDNFLNLERLYRKLIEKSYVDTLRRLEQFQLHTPEERYKTLLLQSPHLVEHIPLKHIASYLGITQVSLSRIRSRVR